MSRVMSVMFALTLVFICIFAGAIGQICLKSGMMRAKGQVGETEPVLSLETFIYIATEKYIIIGMFLYGFAFLLWLGALSSLDVSYIYPLLSLSYVLTAILAVVVLNEDVTFIRWIGILMIVAGCFVVLRT